jgi:hypothetical protein
MENIKTFESINDFCLFLKKSKELDPKTLEYFNPIVSSYENSLGGCGCNRSARHQNAVNIYKKILVECNPENINQLKLFLNASIIIFKQNNIQFAQF